MLPAALAVPADAPTTSTDTLWQGRVHLRQPVRTLGYRFNLDSVLLAGFAADGGVDAHAVDLGAGCGIVGVLLLKGAHVQRVTAVERQPSLLACLRANVTLNGLGGRLEVQAGDLREAAVAPADLVVFNPPYFEAHRGRPSTCLGRDEARRECHGTLADFVVAAGRALRPGGRLACIVPYSRRHQFAAACASIHFGVARLRPVVGFAGTPPRHALLEARAVGFGEPICEPPLILHEADGTYRPEVARLVVGAY